MEKARSIVTRRRTVGMEEKLRALLDDLERQRPTYPERLVIRAAGRVVLLKVEAIDWVDAAGNYVKIHTHAETFSLRETMSGIAERLDPERFVRIHRSTIVNIERIKELQQQLHGDYLVILEGGQRLTLSRSYRSLLQRLVTEST
jgi:two-component system LytT family response regulator